MVHTYKSNGYNIVLDVNSGAVHVVDEVAYDVIEMLEAGIDKKSIVLDVLEKYKDNSEVTKEEIAEIFDDIKKLEKQGKLFSEDIFGQVSLDFKNRQSVVKALCLHVAHDCNLSCKYCFAEEGGYQGKRGLMSLEVGKRALDFLVANSQGRKNLEVDFFGGEPLMNFEVVKQLTAYGRELEKEHNKNFRFTLTTNGVLLDEEVIEFANREMSNVVLSLDGRKEVHDRLRVTCDGCGSYDAVLPMFKKLAESRNHENYYIRGTYTHYNTDFTKDLLHMADLGFKELSIEPVVAPKDMPYALTEEDLPKLFEEYDKLADEMLRRNREGNGFKFYHYTIDLTGGPCVVKRISGCGVGTEYLAVTPEGDLYPCHQFVGDENYLLGDVFGGIANKAACDEFKKCNIYSHAECTDCFARMYCSGGCAANAYHETGSIEGTYAFGCELHRKRVECAIMLQVAQLMPAQ
ncbi:thioether cross-link-forming SCIFF peptide maturase [Clostridium aminobutyricum]|uniref:Thioether cross-link-forming SCIFF peptide maturase n=1 Tax=Clostridium aminobutyricum TaxID=33953 RepID=A0A939D8H0_CLOAM|nr:thioether cross-link-forming SCIFF peptide maturase [Clostridium aminobutyricum]MBN7773055.1 thioether cross-link-forming SCIFF peptide maturase [Clostridium aminobutyricum]